jgi:uncharacterized protein
MQTFTVFVLGPYAAGKTAFIESLSEIGVLYTEMRDSSGKIDETGIIPILDFGRLTLWDDVVLYLLGHPPGRFTGRTIAYLGQRGMPLSQVGFVLLMDSTRPENDRENMTHMRDIEAHNFPYVVALSKQDVPNARTPQQMRQILNIPDDIKLLSYDWKDPKSTKQVVLELVKLFPGDELVQRVIEGLKAKIDEA